MACKSLHGGIYKDGPEIGVARPPNFFYRPSDLIIFQNASDLTLFYK